VTMPPGIISSAVSEILETMYYCEATRAGPGRVAAPAVGAAVTFSGTRRGEFRILASSPLAVRLAADFIAIEPSEVTPLQVRATILEFANVTCGAALVAWKPDGDFDLSVPRSLTDDELLAEWPHRFSIDGGPERLGAAMESAGSGGEMGPL